MIGGKEIIAHKVHTHTQEEGFNSLTNLMLKLPEVYIPIFYIFYDTKGLGKVPVPVMCIHKIVIIMNNDIIMLLPT